MLSSRFLAVPMDHLFRCDEIDPRALQSLIRRNGSRIERYFPRTRRAGETDASCRAFLAGHQAMQASGTSYLFGVRVPQNGGLAGLLYVNSIDPDTAMAELGCFLDRAAEGRGLMQLAMRDAFAWCGAELGLAKVRFLIAPDNCRAIAMARALGFARERREGRLFRAGSKHETVLDYYGLTIE